MGNVGLFAGVIVTCKNVYWCDILQIKFSVLLPHPIMLQSVQKTFIKSHLSC